MIDSIFYYTVDFVLDDFAQLQANVSALSMFKTRCSVTSVVTLWIVAHHAPLSVGFCRQQYYSGLP